MMMRMMILAFQLIPPLSLSLSLFVSRTKKNVPWPLSTRDVVIRATAVDDIAATQSIVVRMKSLQSSEDDAVVPDLESSSSSVVRIDFEGGILFRLCPEEKRLPRSHNDNDDDDDDSEEDSVLVSFKMYMDPKMTSIPSSVINFVTRTVIGTMWNMLLQVAEGVRDGKRPEHQTAIDQRPELYEWIDERIQVLLASSASSSSSSSSTAEDQQPQQQQKSQSSNKDDTQKDSTTAKSTETATEATETPKEGDQDFIAYLQS